MASLPYNRGLLRLGTYGWLGPQAIGVMLVKNTYVFSRLHNYVSDVVAHEAAGTGYNRIASIVGSRTAVEDDINNAAILGVADGTLTWAALNVGLDVRVVTFFLGAGGLGGIDGELLCYYDSGSGVPLNTIGGSVSLGFSANGAIRFEG